MSKKILRMIALAWFAALSILGIGFFLTITEDVENSAHVSR